MGAGETEAWSAGRGALPRLFVGAGIPTLALAIALLSYGMTAGEVLRLGLLHALAVALPGYLIGAALLPGPRLVAERIALAWPMGQALLFGAELGAASADSRDLVIPAVVAIAVFVAVVARHRLVRAIRADGGRLLTGSDGLVRWSSVLGFAVGALVLTGACAGQYFDRAPLPRDLDGGTGVQYYQDTIFHLALSAEASERFPPADPQLAGRDIHYHYFAHLDLAEKARISDIDREVLLLRSYPLVPLLATLLPFVVLVGRVSSRGAFLVPLAVAGFVCLGEVDLSPYAEATYLNVLFRFFFLSPTFAIAMPLMAAAMIWVSVLLRDSWQPGPLLGLLLCVAFLPGIKGTQLPALLGGLGLLAFVLLVREGFRGREFRRVAVLTAVPAACFFLVSALLYSGGSTQSVRVAFAEFLSVTSLSPPVDMVEPARTAAEVVLVPPALALAFLPVSAALLIGAVERRRSGWFTRDPFRMMLLFQALCGFGLYLIVSHSGFSQIYLMLPGLFAAAILSTALLGEWVAEQAGRYRSQWVGGAAIALVTALIAAVWLYDLDVEPKTLHLAIPAGVGLAVLALAAATGRDHLRASLAAAAVGSLLALGALDVALDSAGPALKGEGGPEAADGRDVRGVTADQLDAYEWLGRNGGREETLSQNVTDQDPDDPREGRWFAVAAFSGIDAYVGGWAYSDSAEDEPLPFEERLPVNADIYSDECGQVLAALDESGVDIVLFDRFNGPALVPPPLARSMSVFSNRDIEIFRAADVAAGCREWLG